MKTFKRASLMTTLFLSLGVTGPVLASDSEGSARSGRLGVGKTSAPRQQGESTVRTGEGNYGSGVDRDTGRNPKARHGGKEQKVHPRSDEDKSASGSNDKAGDGTDHGGEPNQARPNMKVESVERNSGSATSPGGASAPVQP